MIPRLVLFAAMASLLTACESSVRLPSLGSPFGQSQRVAPAIEAAPTPRVQSAPLAAPVTQQELPPPPGTQQSQAPVYPTYSQPQIDPQAGTTPSINAPLTTPAEPPKTAKVEPPKTPSKAAEPETPSAPSRYSVTGNWTATEAAGASCKLTLSSTPKLDLYNAGASGCQNKDLQKITAWELRGEEVYLYESGGAVTARLKSSGNGRFNGALTKTGAPITLSK